MRLTRNNPILSTVSMAFALSALPAFGNDSAEIFGSAPQILVTSSRLGQGLIGSSTTIITSKDIAASPASDLPDILAEQAGVQLQSLFGGVNGTNATIGLRGFGATAAENTLVLVNGRRINDPDQSNIDFSAIPLASIERVEITRGNSAAVLYGDGAVGGVINIITKTGDGGEPWTSVDTALGSFQYRSVNLATNQKIGDTSMTVFATNIDSHGYRQNNALRERNFDAELRQKLGNGELYLNLRGDDQHLGLPGALDASLYPSQRKIAQNPFDAGDVESVNTTLGGTFALSPQVQLVVDGGLRHKEVQSYFVSSGFMSPYSFYGIDLTTLSLTPRFNITSQLYDFTAKTTAGFDLYQSYYRSNYAVAHHAVPWDSHLLDQRTYAAYAEESLTLDPLTSLGFGLRLQRADLRAREHVDLDAPGYAFITPGIALNQSDDEFAAHLGLERQIGAFVTSFGRVAHSMRMPNMDDRNAVLAYPTDFRLKTQTSNDAEIGARLKWNKIEAQASIYGMQLRREIDYDPAQGPFGANVNLDPTQRYGIDSETNLEVTPDFRLTSAASLTKAEFRDGPYRGREVPQVAIFAGNLGGSYDIWRQYLTIDANLRYIGPRHLGNDFTGAAPEVPANTTLDLKFSGHLDALRWSVAAQNLLDRKSYDTGYYSPYGRSIYPLAGRNVIARLGATF